MTDPVRLSDEDRSALNRIEQAVVAVAEAVESIAGSEDALAASLMRESEWRAVAEMAMAGLREVVAARDGVTDSANGDPPALRALVSGVAGLIGEQAESALRECEARAAFLGGLT